MDRIHETGIVGSLRWWYEAVVRGLGGKACDPTAENGCEYKPKNESPPEEQLCPVCYVFGATGWRRRFRVEGPVWWNEQRSLTFRPFLLPDNLNEEDLWQTLLLTMRIISEVGGLGARTQQGYGVVDMEVGDYRLDVDRAFDAFDKLKRRHNRRGVNRSGLPSLDKFFFAKARFKLSDDTNPADWLKGRASDIRPNDGLEWYLRGNNAGMSVLPIAPVVRYHLRQMIRQARDRRVFSHPVRHRLMGKQGRKSLIHISHAYLIGNGFWEFRIWGWVPDDLEGVSRKKVLNRLKGWLGVSREGEWEEVEGGEGTLWEKLNLTGVRVWWREVGDVRGFVGGIMNI